VNIVSISRALPTPDDPSQGIFVYNRLAAMARQSTLTAIQPVPYFPLLRPKPPWASAHSGFVTATPMFYLPGVFKSLDATWLARSIAPVIDRLRIESGVDVLDAHFGYPDGAGAVKVARERSLPVFITVRGVENEQLSQRGVGERLQAALGDADGCICVSRFLAEVVCRAGVPEERICVIHNAIDRTMFRPDAADADRRELDLPTGVPVVVSVGHLIPRKRHEIVLRAMADLHRRGRTFHLTIVGGEHQDPAYTARMKGLASELGLAEFVRFRGNRPPEDVSRLMRAADAFVLVSAREGCCNAILEALGCGLPVVATDVGDNSFFVRDGVNGRIVPVDAIAETGRALEDVLARIPWDRTAISASLPVKDWADVATKVLMFMSRRLRGAA
jgi:glycosyltransferase involved in cell wall biosynthesis